MEKKRVFGGVFGREESCSECLMVFGGFEAEWRGVDVIVLSSVVVVVVVGGGGGGGGGGGWVWWWRLGVVVLVLVVDCVISFFVCVCPHSSGGNELWSK